MKAIWVDLGLYFWTHYSGASNGSVILGILEPLLNCWRKNQCKPTLSCIRTSSLLRSALFVSPTAPGCLEKAPRCCLRFREVVLPESVSLCFGGGWNVWECVRADGPPLGDIGSPSTRWYCTVCVETHYRALKSGVNPLHFSGASVLRVSRFLNYDTHRIMVHSAELRHH